jgi:hypothetical protein
MSSILSGPRGWENSRCAPTARLPGRSGRSAAGVAFGTVPVKPHTPRPLAGRLCQSNLWGTDSEFVALRKRARIKRDKITAQARAEYEATLVQVAALEQQLTGIRPKRDRSAASCIESGPVGLRRLR